MNNNIALYKANDPYEQLIQNIILVESEPQARLQVELGDQKRMQGVLKDVDSRISALHTLVKQFTDAFDNTFQAKTSSVPSTAGFGISAGDSAAFGSHTIDVQRLASTDTRISKQYTSAGTSLRSFFDTNGSQTFSIQVAHPTDADASNRVSIDVTVDPTGSTDEEILDEIATAIDTAMSDAVTADQITTEERTQASVVNETSDTARLSVRSGQTGFANRLQFTDSANGLLALLETTTDAVASGTGGGQVTAVGTSETDSELNSMFVLDGLTLYRATNKVSDALEDVTITLSKSGDGPTDFSVNTDSNSIKSQIDDFIGKYNDLLTYIAGKTNVDGDTGVRGDFAGDPTMRSLRFEMRNDVVRSVTGLPSGAPTSITDLGFEIDKDGTLSLADEDALLAAVEKDSTAVEDLFSGTDGIATRLLDRLDRYTGTKGIISNRQDSVQNHIDRLNDRIDDWDDRLSKREDQLRKQFAQLQQSISLFQSQQQNLNTFFGGAF